MTSLVTTRDIYGRKAKGGPITRLRGAPRRLSAPRERTLTELGLRDTRFDPPEQLPHYMLPAVECSRLRCNTHGHDYVLEYDCGD